MKEPQICRLAKMYFDFGYTVLVDRECPNFRRAQFECPKISRAAPECALPEHLVPHVYAKKGERAVIAHVIDHPDIDSPATRLRFLNFCENADQVIAYVPWDVMVEFRAKLKEWGAARASVEGWGPTRLSRGRRPRAAR